LESALENNIKEILVVRQNFKFDNNDELKKNKKVNNYVKELNKLDDEGKLSHKKIKRKKFQDLFLAKSTIENEIKHVDKKMYDEKVKEFKKDNI